MTVSSKRIFSGSRSTFPGDLRDASSGAAANKSDVLDYDDATPFVTGQWANAYSATRFYQLDFNSPRPAGVPASSVNFNIKYATVTGTSYASWTLFEKSTTDQSTGAATTTPWTIATAEATGTATTSYTSASNWPAAATTTKYLQVTFDHPDLPAGAVVQS